ncbi:protein trichome birefringence-like 19 [Senna tora]|uniref:Protein trichome birefringence-like 19 n=1 Tax=Senna tora TaxID=362788 RepID=A0A834TIE7_9FABA|nr:protein trichome birefringence-like 19 [Senna tora]
MKKKKIMKLQAMEVVFGKNTPKQMIPKVTLLAIFAILLFTVSPLSYPLFGYPFPLSHTRNNNIPVPPNSPPPSSFDDLNESTTSLPSTSIKMCDLSTGEWIPNPKAPYYTNTTCWAIHEHQNCLKYGRPDSEFMKWRWKPNGCELPIFNPFQFLEIVRGKSMAFVGDSIVRNQMQSMICLLSRAEWPVDASFTPDEYFKRWKYPSYNFTMATFWTPHLVKSKEADSAGPTNSGLFDLYLDEADGKWAAQMAGFDYIILNGGHWFMRPMIFYEKQKIVGCHFCGLNNLKDLTMFYGYRKAFRTAFRAIYNLKNFKGITFLKTFTPSHFENGLWNEGGNCVRTRPFKSSEIQLEGTNLEFYMIQMEEFNIAEKEAKKKGLKFRVLDTTQAMLMRPDGHPSRYGHWAHENVNHLNGHKQPSHFPSLPSSQPSQSSRPLHFSHPRLRLPLDSPSPPPPPPPPRRSPLAPPPPPRRRNPRAPRSHRSLALDPRVQPRLGARGGRRRRRIGVGGWIGCGGGVGGAAILQRAQESKTELCPGFIPLLRSSSSSKESKALTTCGVFYKRKQAQLISPEIETNKETFGTVPS